MRLPVPLFEGRRSRAAVSLTPEPADGVSLQRIVTVLDQLRGVGARQVSFLEATPGE